MPRTPIRLARSELGVGVDFGVSSVKAVGLSLDRRGVGVHGAGLEPLPVGAVEDGAVRDPESASGALGRLLDRIGIRRRGLAVAIGGGAVFVKHLRVSEEPGPNGRFRDAVAKEAARHVPFHMEDVSFDFVGARGEGGSATPGRVLFAAAPRSLLDAQCAAITGSGRHVEKVEIEPFGLLAAAHLDLLLSGTEEPPQEALVIVQIGASRAGIHVFDGFPRRPAAPPTAGMNGAGAGNEAPADLLASLDCPGASGEAILRAAADEAGRPIQELRAGVRDGGWPDGAGPAIAAAAGRIRETVEDAVRQSGFPKNPRILLSGGGALLPGLVEAVERAASLPAAVLGPLARIRPDLGPVWSLAAGLAVGQLRGEVPPASTNGR